MLKYVADKINSYDRKNCQCFHYTLTEAARERFGLSLETDWYTTRVHDFRGRKEKFRFHILSVDLYCFNTTVCMFAYKINLEKDDPIWISTAQYYLKKVSREKIGFDSEAAETFTFLGISEKIMRQLGPVSTFDFFYYANPSTERANIFTYLEVKPKEDYKYELFYLRRCYKEEGFMFAENEKTDEAEIYTASQDTIWGISSEAAVCLVCPEYGRGDFIRSRFCKNFNEQYLFMYVLLLHQKYVLYMFLMKIGIGTYNDLKTLEKYRNELCEFETDFVFSCITEVPQYQNLYERMTQAFSLKRMYEDVHEPLQSLSEIRRMASDKEQKKRDDNVDRALLLLTLLSFFSAQMDGFGFIESFFSWFLSKACVMAVQIVCVIAIFVVFVYVVVSLVRFRKKDPDD